MMNVVIVRVLLRGVVHVRTKIPRVLIQISIYKIAFYYWWAISQNYTWKLYKHIDVVHDIRSAYLLLLFIS